MNAMTRVPARVELTLDQEVKQTSKKYNLCHMLTSVAFDCVIVPSSLHSLPSSWCWQ